MKSRVLFFDRFGVPVDEMELYTSRSSAINKIGEAIFTIPRTDPKLTEKLVRYGNFVLITGVGDDWVGVIDLPRIWRRSGIEVHAYSAEIMLGYRSPDKVDPHTNKLAKAEMLTGTIGAIYSTIIARANAEQDTLIRPGDIWMGGKRDCQRTLRGKNLYTHMQEAANLAGVEFNVTPSVLNNRLILYGNLYQSLGSDKRTQIILEEGVNLITRPQDDLLTENGELSNLMAGTGDGATDAKLAATGRDDNSISLYGIRHIKTQTFAGVTQLATLKTNVQNVVSNSANPEYQIRAMTFDQNLMNAISIGDLTSAQLHTAGFGQDGTIGGFSGYARVLSTNRIDKESVMDILLTDLVTT